MIYSKAKEGEGFFLLSYGHINTFINSSSAIITKAFLEQALLLRHINWTGTKKKNAVYWSSSNIYIPNTLNATEKNYNFIPSVRMKTACFKPKASL